MMINIGTISTVEDAFGLVTEILKLTTGTLQAHQEFLKAQLAGAKPSESQLRNALGNIEEALSGMAKTQNAVDMTVELRKKLGEAPPARGVQ